VLVALLCEGQEALSPDLASLVKIKGKVAQNLKQLPNFTCTETIERWVKRTTDHKPEMLDTVHLEVAYVDGEELFGPPKAGRIDQPEIQKLVSGSISKGSFATIVSKTILGASTMFHDEGSSKIEGRPAELFSFRVPILGSGYRVTTSSGRAIAGYRGKFWVDPETFDLMRFEMAADDIPPILELASASEAIDYRRVNIGNSPFPLPHVSELRMKAAQGSEIRNVTTYQDCRQFVAGSTLSFATDSTAPSVEAPAAPSNLPDDFTVRIRWETSIDPASSRAGDPVSAKLLEDIKMKEAVAVPKGAKLSGHIDRLDTQGGGLAIKLVFTSFDFKAGHIELGQRLSEIKPIGDAKLSPGAQFTFRSQR
jgi:hypothetical protein